MTFFKAILPDHKDAQNRILFFFFLTAAMLFCLAVPRSLSFLPALTALFALGAYTVRERSLPIPQNGFAVWIWLGGFLALCALSSLWSYDGGYAISRVGKSAALALSGFILITAAGTISFAAEKQRRCHMAAVLLFCSLAGIAIAAEYLYGFAITKSVVGEGPGRNPEAFAYGYFLNRNMVYLVLLMLPAGLILLAAPLAKPVKILCVLLLAAALTGALLLTKSQTAQITALIIVFMALYPSHKKWARLLVLCGALAAIFTLPFLTRPAYQAVAEKPLSDFPSIMQKASAPHRLEVWNFIGQKIAEKPFFGHGIEATRFLKSDEIMTNMNSNHIMHPHNIILQIWIELGLAGAFIAAGFAAFLILRMDRFSPLAQRYYMALFVSLFTVLCVGYSMWQAWQIGMIFSLVAFSIAIFRFYGLEEPKTSSTTTC